MASNASPYSPHSSAATGAEPQRSPGSDVVAVPPPEPNEPVFAPVDELTRARRLATSIEWLAQGKRRNWKYER